MAVLLLYGHESVRPHFSRRNLVHITPDPVFARLDRPHQGVLAVVEMFGGVLVLRRVAAGNMAALEAKPQMYPRISGLGAVFTHAFIRSSELDRIDM